MSETKTEEDRRKVLKAAIGLGAVGIGSAAALTYTSTAQAGSLSGTEVNAVDTTNTDLVGISPTDRSHNDLVYTLGLLRSRRRRWRLLPI